MKTVTGRTALSILCLAAQAVQADFSGTDTFTSGSANWIVMTNSGSASLTVANGHYGYAASGAGTTRDMAWRGWNVNQGSYTNDWAVQVDVHLNAFPGLNSLQAINLNLGVLGGDALNQNYAVAIDRYLGSSGVVMDFYSGLSGITREITNTTLDAALRISFDSDAKTLTAWYDANGAANGYTWIPMETVGIPTGPDGWNMDNLVRAGLGGSSGITGDQNGPDFAVTSAQAYFDNFIATSGRSPTNAFTVTSIIPNGSNGVFSAWGAAFDGANYLVGFQGDPTDISDISAQLISYTGAQLGGLISVGRTGGAPHTAFDGANYLLVWPDDARGDMTNDNDSVCGQFISRAGELVGSPFVISQLPPGPRDEDPFGVCFDGSNYLVGYAIGTNIHMGPVNQLACRLVSPEGFVGSEIPLASGNLSEGTIAYNGNNYLVTWAQHHSNASNDINGVLVSKSGTISATNHINQSNAASDSAPIVTAGGANFLVGWLTGPSAGNPPLWQLHGRIVTASGGFGSTDFTAVTVTNMPFGASMAFDGVNYIVTWSDCSNPHDWNIAGRFVSSIGTLVGPTLKLVTCPGNQGLPQVVHGQSRNLLVWNDDVTTNTPDGVVATAIRGMFVPVLPTNPVPVIGGIITRSGTQTGVAGVTLLFSNGGGSTMTDDTGSYALAVSNGWSGTVTPTNAAGGVFAPAKLTYANVTISQYGHNYIWSPPPIISGRVTKSGTTNGVPGVTITFSRGAGIATTDNTGSYSNTVPYKWTGTATASFTNGGFAVSNITYATALIANQTSKNYVWTPPPMISGKVIKSGGTVGVPGVTITFSRGAGIATTDNTGSYSNTVPYKWTGTATASFTNGGFAVSNITYATAVIANQTAKNYTWTPPPMISGKITRTGTTTGVSGVTLTFSSGAGVAITSSNGSYSNTVPYNWTGVVTPATTNGGTFIPASKTFATKVIANATVQNFTWTAP